MLKPRYTSMRDLLEDHASLCRGMDGMNPRDRTLPAFQLAQREEAERRQYQLQEDRRREQQVLTENTERQRQVARPEVAHMSRYGSSSAAMHSFKVLAGMITEEVMPRDPGLMSSTRSEAAYRSDTARKIPKKF